MEAEFRVLSFFFICFAIQKVPTSRRVTNLVFWEMVNFSNIINYLATQMNNETSFKQHNKEMFIIVAGVKE